MSPAQISDSSEILKYEQKQESKKRKSDDESNQQKSSDVTIDQTNVKIEEKKADILQCGNLKIVREINYSEFSRLSNLYLLQLISRKI